MSDSATLVGKALYLEFRKGVNTAQIIITPEAMTTEGAFVPAGTWRRQISQWSPRKPWKTYFANGVDIRKALHEPLNEIVALPTKDEAVSFGQSSILDLTNTMNNLYNNEWKLFMTPIVLDFSYEDLLNTKAWETPTALIRRILRARKELGFPDELIEAPAE